MKQKKIELLAKPGSEKWKAGGCRSSMPATGYTAATEMADGSKLNKSVEND